MEILDQIDGFRSMPIRLKAQHNKNEPIASIPTFPRNRYKLTKVVLSNLLEALTKAHERCYTTILHQNHFLAKFPLPKDNKEKYGNLTLHEHHIWSICMEKLSSVILVLIGRTGSTIVQENDLIHGEIFNFQIFLRKDIIMV